MCLSFLVGSVQSGTRESGLDCMYVQHYTMSAVIMPVKAIPKCFEKQLTKGMRCDKLDGA